MDSGPIPLRGMTFDPVSAVTTIETFGSNAFVTDEMILHNLNYYASPITERNSNPVIAPMFVEPQVITEVDLLKRKYGVGPSKKEK